MDRQHINVSKVEADVEKSVNNIMLITWRSSEKLREINK